MGRKIAIEIICFSFIVLFVYTAASKLFDYDKFRIQISQSPMLTNYTGLIVWIVPGIEILIAVMLVFPELRATGLYAAFSLMVMFTTYIILVLHFSEHIPCSCGGVLENLTWRDHLIFNSGFISIGAIGILIHTRKGQELVIN